MSTASSSTASFSTTPSFTTTASSTTTSLSVASAGVSRKDQLNALPFIILSPAAHFYHRWCNDPLHAIAARRQRRRAKQAPYGYMLIGGSTSQLAPDDAYLSYYDARLTKEDVDCIKSGWLTDNGIQFWQEYLEHEKLVAYPSAQIQLLRPSMAFMIIQTPDPLSLVSALPSFRKSTHIFLPINDSTSPQLPEGGSHWSLLLVSIIDGVAFHYDSMYPSNAQSAHIACDKFSQLLQKPLKFVNLNDTPQQENGSDCGVFVCLCMRYLVFNRLLKREANQMVSMSMRGMEVDAGKGRREMTKLIEDLRREGSRSPSRGRDKNTPPRVGG